VRRASTRSERCAATAVRREAGATLARLLRAVLVSVSPADPIVYGAAAAFTIVVALLSVAVPAWRALRVDPIQARCQ